jgi:hypothetical protein
MVNRFFLFCRMLGKTWNDLPVSLKESDEKPLEKDLLITGTGTARRWESTLTGEEQTWNSEMKQLFF